MFATWNIADSLLTDLTDGHQYWEPRLLSEELKRRGKTVRLLGHKSIAAQNFPAAECIPAFPLYFTEPNSPDRTWGYIENFVVQNRSVAQTLIGLRPRPDPDSLVLFPNVSERQMLGVFRWLEFLAPDLRPSVALVLGAIGDWTPSNPSLGIYRKLWADCPPALKQIVRLCARTEITAQKFHELMGTTPFVLPSVLTPTASEIEVARRRAAGNGGPMTVAFVGGARHERGATLIPDVVKQCLPLKLRFLVQITDSMDISFGVASMRALQGLEGVELREGMLPREDYNAWIAQSLVLLPYERESYRWRSSGVYFEAKCFGSPVIVPEGTWMADEVRQYGNGLIFEQYSPHAIAKCIACAQGELPELRARAQALAPAFRAQHGVDRFVDKVESLFPA